ncbi:MAG: hypothetical protein D3922_01500 [Candidatus Electrothrix sp. AR1]|nr:hypothetical protein [Candidatus Electrothrix sp. AR1]
MLLLHDRCPSLFTYYTTEHSLTGFSFLFFEVSVFRHPCFVSFFVDLLKLRIEVVGFSKLSC